MNEEDNLLKEFGKLVSQCRKNIDGDCPSKDDVLCVFAVEYIGAIKKLVSEKDYLLDIALTRLAKLTGSKNLGVLNES